MCTVTLKLDLAYSKESGWAAVVGIIRLEHRWRKKDTQTVARQSLTVRHVSKKYLSASRIKFFFVVGIVVSVKFWDRPCVYTLQSYLPIWLLKTTAKDNCVRSNLNSRNCWWVNSKTITIILFFSHDSQAINGPCYPVLSECIVT